MLTHYIKDQRLEVFQDLGFSSFYVFWNLFSSGRGVDKCVEFIDKNYMFYLAFENSFCEDYVSEKLWNHLNPPKGGGGPEGPPPAVIRPPFLNGQR